MEQVHLSEGTKMEKIRYLIRKLVRPIKIPSTKIRTYLDLPLKVLHLLFCKTEITLVTRNKTQKIKNRFINLTASFEKTQEYLPTQTFNGNVVSQITNYCIPTIEEKSKFNHNLAF